MFEINKMFELPEWLEEELVLELSLNMSFDESFELTPLGTPSAEGSPIISCTLLDLLGKIPLSSTITPTRTKHVPLLPTVDETQEVGSYDSRKKKNKWWRWCCIPRKKNTY
eukprot:GHVR01171267.1.p1 GENE.GHVR01171267.1~~GHVR01171267.1.p1  ORF type:complete len:111 (+),score=17.01 GHVR01171267.1:54-386(+)